MSSSPLPPSIPNTLLPTYNPPVNPSIIPQNSTVNIVEIKENETESVHSKSSNKSSSYSSNTSSSNKRYTYEGNKKNNIPHGFGIYIDHQTESRYEGDFFEGVREGVGTLMTPEYTLTGNFKNNHPDGIMNYKTQNFTIIGQMKNGKFVGNCVITHLNSCVRYEGPLYQFKMHGEGRIDFGDTYFKGLFIHDQKQHGQLINRKTGEIIYEGPFYEDQPIKDSSKVIVSDEQIAYLIPSTDQSQNQIKIVFSSGDIYIGQHEKFAMHGVGTYYFADGKIYSGQFKNNTMHGEGELQDDQGLHVGKFQNGIKHGEGTYYPNNGPPEKGDWVNNFKMQNQNANSKC